LLLQGYDRRDFPEYAYSGAGRKCKHEGFMNIDLCSVPFSRNGAYLAFSILAESGKWPKGLYLRSVHGGAQQERQGGRVALIEVVKDGQVLPFDPQFTPAVLVLNTTLGNLSICISEPWLVRVKGEGVGIRLTFAGRQGDYAIPTGVGRWQINTPQLMVQYMLSSLSGSWQVDSNWNGTGTDEVVLELKVLPETGICEAAIEEITSSWHQRIYDESFEDSCAIVEEDFQDWLDAAPQLPLEYAETRYLAAYVTWSSLVEPIGHFLRQSMYMSKNWMTNVWSWDHCFNAMALIYQKPIVAWDQLMTLFDQQDEFGALPDYYNDRGILWNFCKPPIHGWVLNWMMQRTNFFRLDQIRQIYGPLARWTEWWFRFRDDDKDGIPQYHHGNDSGWDNATPFLAGVPLESPDLCAYLVLQMETLAKLAGTLNNLEEAESWQRRSEELFQNTLAHFWQGDHFVAMRSGDHLVGDTESLFLYLPLILGKRLPTDVRRELILGLTRPGRFITQYGLATESPESADYNPDGYWRGPIWAPSTMIIVEGLAACGELDLARSLARKFCDLCAANGFAENFNALTGAGLRDRAYTWTASVFLILGHEFLLAEE
jgi:putative isomerase